ncbi:putative DNA-binding protein (MmcQ/YjbR family) [Mucilaginibacter gracilis]|uniref:Putative DNA-binding protein (MmcQ/YjbR family) n=2 Tax=Mucilaginibacter gracilis TaxID=423350 RepID=A0A495J7H3_9SPHI|nr:putative DNA-binding protein (MmcQ/YjbR family) [Mucilaginibacter gracilis]
MTIEDIETICDQFPAVTKDIKWEEYLCFNVGGKMFLITSPDAVPPNAAFKVTPEEFEELASRDGFKPAPHLARYKWVHINDVSRFTKTEWEFYAQQSYNLVVAKLSLKLKNALGL